ncbi:MAG: monooxygenase [Dehalococcoidia bacterium]|nr:MAG: monooxygenase [Dehalococcoidia bacterium]
MRVGYYINPQTPGPREDGRIIEEVIGQVDLAERLGFSDVWITEHAFTGYNAYSDPVVLASAIGQRTRAMRIGFSVAVAPYHHPIRFVTQCNLLDQLSGGRLIVGFGAGNSPDEFRGYGLDANDRHAMLNEWIAICLQAWGQNDASQGFAYGERFWKGEVRGRIIPAPVQQPHPHIAWGTSTDDTAVRVAQMGWSLLIGPRLPQVIIPRLRRYAQALEESGHDAETKARAWRDTGQLQQIYVAAPGEDWRATIGEAIEVYVRKSALANSGIDDLPKDDLQRRMAAHVGGWLIAGTVDEVLPQLVLRAKLGLGHLMCWFNFGHLSDHLVRRSMERFAADIAPVLAETAPDPDLVEELARQTPVAAPQR